MQEKSQTVDFEKQKQQNRHQTLEIRRQRGGVLEALEGLEGLDTLEGLDRLEVLEKLEAQQRAMAKLERKPNNIARYARAYAHITGVLCFLLSQVSHKHYNPLSNNHLHR